MVDDREREIENFKPEEYWTLDANLTGKDVKKLPFSARFHGKNGKKAELKSAAEAEGEVIVDADFQDVPEEAAPAEEAAPVEEAASAEETVPAEETKPEA